MVKVPLKYVTVYGNGNSRQLFSYYRRKIDDKWHKFRIRGELGTPEWHLNYQRIHDSFETKKKLGPEQGTLGSMIASYYGSRRYQSLRPKTRANYRGELERVPEKLLKAPVGLIKRPIIITLCDKIAETSPRRSIEMAKALSQVFKNALNKGLIELNPLSEPIEKPIGHKATPWRPWTDDELSTFLDGAHPLRRRSVMVLLYTGLRRGDATRLRRSDIVDGRLTLTTGKTGTQVVIPIHSQLAAELERPLEVDSLFLICGARGLKIRDDSLSKEIMKECRRLGMNPSPPLHGLRKNAVMNLIEAGCEPREVQAITGQSLATIEHYAQGYKRKRLAEAAISKLERKK